MQSLPYSVPEGLLLLLLDLLQPFKEDCLLYLLLYNLDICILAPISPVGISQLRCLLTNVEEKLYSYTSY